MFEPRGIVIPVITPVDENERFNSDTYRKLIRFWRENGVHGIFPFGTTGEFYGFSDDEYQEMLDVSVEEAGGMHVYAGTNHITPKGVIRLARMAEKAGVDALSVLTPMFVSQTQNEIYEFYKYIAEHTPLPIVVYNNRPKTNVQVQPDTIARLAEIPNIVAVKDSTGDMTNTEEYIRLTRGMKDFSVLMGRDTLIYAALCYGAKGAIASCANVAPGIAVEIYDKFIKGDHRGALEAQFKFAALRVSTSMGSFPVVIKEAMKMLGMDVGDCIAPIKPLNEIEREKLGRVLKEIGLAAVAG